MNEALSFIHGLWPHHYRPILITLALIAALTWAAALARALPGLALNPFARIERLNQNTWTLRLAGDCYLDYHIPAQALALACPGVDYIKLWPWPVEQPGDAGSVAGGVAGGVCEEKLVPGL